MFNNYLKNKLFSKEDDRFKRNDITFYTIFVITLVNLKNF